MKSNSTPKAPKKWSFKLLPMQNKMLRVVVYRLPWYYDFVNNEALPEQWDKEFEWHNLKRANSYHDTMK